jgi:hypothetical protein
MATTTLGRRSSCPFLNLSERVAAAPSRRHRQRAASLRKRLQSHSNESLASTPEAVVGGEDQALARIRKILARFPGAAKAAQQLRDPVELQAELDLLARLRSQFKGSPVTSDEIIAAIERENHPPENKWFAEEEAVKA